MTVLNIGVSLTFKKLPNRLPNEFVPFYIPTNKNMRVVVGPIKLVSLIFCTVYILLITFLSLLIPSSYFDSVCSYFSRILTWKFR